MLLATEQKLSPAMTTLSGTRDEVHEVAKHTAPPARPRICAVCKCGDRATVIDGEFDAVGRPKVEHLVTIELEYIKDRSALTPYKVSRGWQYKFHQGRHAMERFICRPCLRGAEVMRRDWMRKCAGDGSPKANHDGFYGDLCG